MLYVNEVIHLTNLPSQEEESKQAQPFPGSPKAVRDHPLPPLTLEMGRTKKDCMVKAKKHYRRDEPPSVDLGEHQLSPLC